MTEEEFIEGLIDYQTRSLALSDNKEKREIWISYICQSQNRKILEAIVLRDIYLTIEEARTLWQIENSPLSKALA